MKKRWAEIRKIINELSKDDFLDLFKEIYTLNKTNVNYLHAKFFNDKETIDGYKKQISNYLIVEPYEKKPQLASAKKVISDFKKANVCVISLLELIVCYLECGLYMASDFGYYESNFYGSMQSMFRMAIKIIHENTNETLTFKNKLMEIKTSFLRAGWEIQEG